MQVWLGLKWYTTSGISTVNPRLLGSGFMSARHKYSSSVKYWMFVGLSEVDTTGRIGFQQGLGVVVLPASCIDAKSI